MHAQHSTKGGESCFAKDVFSETVKIAKFGQSEMYTCRNVLTTTHIIQVCLSDYQKFSFPDFSHTNVYMHFKMLGLLGPTH